MNTAVETALVDFIEEVSTPASQMEETGDGIWEALWIIAILIYGEMGRSMHGRLIDTHKKWVDLGSQNLDGERELSHKSHPLIHPP